MISYQTLFILVLITIIVAIPYLDDKNKFRLNAHKLNFPSANNSMLLKFNTKTIY